MHLKISTVVGCMCMSMIALSCDICSCFRYMYPGEQSSFVELRHRTRLMLGTVEANNNPSFFKHLEHINVNLMDEVNERYEALDLNAQWAIKKGWFAEGRLTFVMRKRHINSELAAQTRSLGDARLGLGKVLVQPKLESGKWIYMASASLGVKLPTGHTDLYFQDEVLDFDMQPGTGSLDIYGVIKQSLVRNKFGLSSILVAQRNGSNLSGYRFGHSINASLGAFGSLELGNQQLLPQLGLAIESAGADKNDGECVSQTKYTRLLGQIGMTIRAGSWQLQAAWQPTITQTTNESQLPLQYISTAGFSKNF